MSDSRRPRSTHAQIFTAIFAGIFALAAVAMVFFALVAGTIATQVAGAVGGGFQEAGGAVAVPAAESVCLNYAATILELDEAGLDPAAIERVIDSAVQVEDADADELAELHEMSLTSESFCGPIQNVLDAAGR